MGRLGKETGAGQASAIAVPLLAPGHSNRRLGRVNRFLRTGVGFRNRKIAPYAETHRRRICICRAGRHTARRAVRRVQNFHLGLHGQDDGCSGTVRTRVLAGDRSNSHLLRQAAVAASCGTGRVFALHHAQHYSWLVWLSRLSAPYTVGDAGCDGLGIRQTREG